GRLRRSATCERKVPRALLEQRRSPRLSAGGVVPRDLLARAELVGRLALEDLGGAPVQAGALVRGKPVLGRAAHERVLEHVASPGGGPREKATPRERLEQARHLVHGRLRELGRELRPCGAS